VLRGTRITGSSLSEWSEVIEHDMRQLAQQLLAKFRDRVVRFDGDLRRSSAP
jgi:hypothetical protein